MGSGTLITCAFGAQLGRKVMAIPANLDSRHSAGCWKLIREGAMMATSVKDVIAAVKGSKTKAADVPKAAEAIAKPGRARSPNAPTAVSARPPYRVLQVPLQAAPKVGARSDGKGLAKFSIEEQAVLKQIPSTGITLDRLAFKTKLPAKVVGDMTMSLRMKRLIRFLPGNRVAPAADAANL